MNSDSSPVFFDIEFSLRRLDGNHKLLADIIEIFNEDAPGIVCELKHQLKNDHCHEVVKLAHALKGLFANFTKKGCFAAAQKIERAARAGNLHEAHAILPDLEHLYSQLACELNEYLNARF